MFHKFAQSTFLLQTTTRFSWVNWKKLTRRMQSLKIVTILRREVAEKNAEFENSDNLKEVREDFQKKKRILGALSLKGRGGSQTFGRLTLTLFCLVFCGNFSFSFGF